MHPLSLRVYVSRSVRSELNSQFYGHSETTHKISTLLSHATSFNFYLPLGVPRKSVHMSYNSAEHQNFISPFQVVMPIRTMESVLLSTHDNTVDLDTCGLGVVRFLAFYNIDLCILVIIYRGIVVTRYCTEVQSVFCACE